MPWLFALISAGACVALGGMAGRRVKERCRLATQWESAFSRMEIALLHGGGLEDALRAGAGDGSGGVMQAAADQLHRHPAQPVEAWLAALPWEAEWTAEEKAILTGLLRALWSPYPDAQLSALRWAREEWCFVAAEARKQKEIGGRLYFRLGCLSGAALLILMC